jgi:hypothetical protein
MLVFGVYHNEVDATLLLAMSSLTTAFIDVVVDALMVA